MSNQINPDPICSKHYCTMTLEMGEFYICPVCEREGRNIKTEVKQFTLSGPAYKKLSDEERKELWEKLKENVDKLNRF